MIQQMLVIWSLVPLPFLNPPWTSGSSQFVDCFSPCWYPVTQSCLTVCGPMECSTPGFPVLHHLLELAQIHVLWVSDITQSSCPLSSSSCLQSFPASGSFQMNWLFASGGQSKGVSPMRLYPFQCLAHDRCSKEVFKFLFIFIYVWLCRVFAAGRAFFFFLVLESGSGYFLVEVWSSHCSGFVLQKTGFRCEGFHSCST